MARTGSFDCGDMQRLQRELEKLQQNTDAFLDACAKELAARLLAKVVKRTPVGQYSGGTGKKGGNLRRGWTGNQRASAQSYADSLPVHHFGGNYVIGITNPVEYAPYVEYGYRTANHKSWVKGWFMLTISEREIKETAPRILEKKIRQFLGDVSR